ncbi:MAG: hypothetical protein IIY81_11715 [Lachnospiraceae bacterium]|nr:hypothetical protein [Lachnospiraceae bacterium]
MSENCLDLSKQQDEIQVCVRNWKILLNNQNSKSIFLQLLFICNEKEKISERKGG